MLPQILAPHNFAGRLKKSQFRHNAMLVAQQILGPEVMFHVDHTLMKPPVEGPPTPWHQDEAFKDPKFECDEISIWMPLQPVDDVNGCMMFIPGTNRGEVLPHRTPGNDPKVHALECYEGYDRATAVSCPCPRVVAPSTSDARCMARGRNRSDAPRYAYVLIFQLPHRPAKTPPLLPMATGQGDRPHGTPAKWMKKGGKFISTWRWLRDKEWRDYKRFFSKLVGKITGRSSSGEDGPRWSSRGELCWRITCFSAKWDDGKRATSCG